MTSSDASSELSKALTNPTNPFSIAARSAVPSIPANRTRHARTRRGLTATEDEYSRYCNAEPLILEEEEVTALDYWLNPAQRSRLPLLSEMAIDIHSIPPMSAEPERVFSGSKHTISDQRNSLKSKTIELLECLKSWSRLGGFTEQDLHAIVGHWNEEGAIEALEAINQLSKPIVSGLDGLGFGPTANHLNSFSLDWSRPLDRRFAPSGALATAYLGNGKGVKASFDDGTEVTGSMLISADSPGSSVRSILVGAERAKPTPIDFATVMCFTSYSRD